MGKEAGSRRGSRAACARMLATLLAFPEMEASLDWEEDECKIGPTLRSWRKEEGWAGPVAEAGPAPVEARGVVNIRTRPPGQARGLGQGRERKQSQTTSLAFIKSPLRKGGIYISPEDEAQVKSENMGIMKK